LHFDYEPLINAIDNLATFIDDFAAFLLTKSDVEKRGTKERKGKAKEALEETKALLKILKKAIR